jgi:hypothetical protein
VILRAPSCVVAWTLLLLVVLAAPGATPRANGEESRIKPTRTAKERLGVKATDEQRIDIDRANRTLMGCACNVAIVVPRFGVKCEETTKKEAASSAFGLSDLGRETFNSIDALRRIFIANRYGCLHGCRVECSLQLFHIVVLNQNDAWCRWRALKRYSFTPTCKELAADVLLHFRNERDELFGKSVLVIDGDFHDLEGRWLSLGMQGLHCRGSERRADN